MRFTKPAVAAVSLPPEKSELILFDDALKGFGIRLRAGGKRTWIVQYRVGNKQRRFSLGPAAAVELEQARSEAKAVLSKVALGGDPAADKERAKEPTPEAVTLGSLVDGYLAFKVDQQGRRPKTVVETTRYLKKLWQPLHARALTAIGRADVAKRLLEIKDTHGGVSAERARAALSAFFTWAMREGMADDNPVRRTNHQHHQVSRERVLSDTELSEVWTACGDDDFGRIVRVLILTGARREEVGGMPVSELDLENAMWTIPRSRTKNHLELKVPLSDPAVAILRAACDHAGDSDYVFGRFGGSGFSGWSKAKSALDQRVEKTRQKRAAEAGVAAKPMPEWWLHDLRRTLDTRLNDDFEVDPHVVEAILNHITGSKPGMARVYNRSEYLRKKRDALTKWGEHVMKLASAGRSVTTREGVASEVVAAG